MRSIRQRLVVPIVGSILLLAVVTGLIAYLYARFALIQHFDSSLATKARAIAALVESERDEDEFHIEFVDSDIPEFLSKESPRYYQVWIAGESLQKSLNLDKDQNLPQFSGEIDDEDSRNITLPDGMPARAVTLHFYPLVEVDEKRSPQTGPNPTRADIIVARDRRDLDQTLWTILASVVAGMIVLPLLSAFIVIRTVKTSLQPVHNLSNAMSEIKTIAATDAFPVLEMPEELQPIALQLSELLGRLRAAFDRERRFTMDASHELRTPLSETRAALEVALKWPDDRELMSASCEMALESTRNMQGLIDALLVLARAESGHHEVFEMKPVDLNRAISHSWGHLESRASQRHLTLVHDDAEGVCEVNTNGALLSSIITNLLDNAVEYSTADNEIIVETMAATSDSAARLTVTNFTSRCLSAEDIDQMFQPLWRKEQSRAVLETDPDERTHAGLGLALVNAFCEILKINLQASLLTNDRFQLVLTFPLETGGIKSH